MSNRVLIPALKASVGDWNYYICVMKYAQVCKQIEFAHDLGGNVDLGRLIQRGISERTKEITEYLLRSEHRFLGAMIVAAWGGSPKYLSVEMENAQGVLDGLDNAFGVLTFDDSVRYFALDGQHRLKAIKDALKIDPNLANEEISVILVSHYDTEDGRKKTRRLFSNINKNARKTTPGEDIALDEDDGYSILTRRLIDEHPFLREGGRVIVFTKLGTSGEISIAGGTIPKTDKKAVTTITTIHDMLGNLGFGLKPSMYKKNIRPPEDVLDESFEILKTRIDDLFKYCGDWKEKIEAAVNARDVRAPLKNEGAGHPMMRSMIQRAVTRVARQIVSQGISWDELLIRLQKITWRLDSPPWVAVASIKDGNVNIKTNRDYVSLLDALLTVHLAPNSKQEIIRARKEYKTLWNVSYPISEDELASNISKSDKLVDEDDAKI
jgi:DNA sulfur modification protein DndB